MQSSKLNMFTNTKNALDNMERMLKCSVCKLSATSPVTLGCCEHIFCSVCCEHYLGASCPVCDLPAQAKDAEVDRQLFNMATLCGRLRDILDEVTNKSDNRHDSVEESIYCTPNQGGVDMALVTKQEFTGVKTKNTKAIFDKTTMKGSKRKKQSTGSLTNVDTVSEVVKVGETDTDDSKVSASTNDKKQNTDKSVKMSDISNTYVEKANDKKATKTRNKRSSLPESMVIQESITDDARIPGKSLRTTKLRSSSVEVKTNSSEMLLNKDSPLDSNPVETPTRSSRQRKNKDTSKKMEVTDSVTGGQKKGKKNSNQGPVPGVTKENPAKIIQEKQEETKQPNSTPTGKKKQKPRPRNSLDDVANIDQKVPSSTGSTPELNNSILNDITGSGKLEKSKGKRKKGADNIVEKNSCHGSPTTSLKRKHSGDHTPRPTDTSWTPNSQGLNKKNAKGETLLHVAAIKNDVSKVLQLLEGGANPNVRDNAGWTPLHEACNHGYTEVARLLLDHGAMMNVPGFENDSPLHDAVSNNRLDCVKLLVSRGASTNTRNLHGLTPVDYAKTKELKEALKTKVTQPLQTETQMIDVLEYQQPCLLGTGLSREEKSTLQKTASKLKVKLSDEVAPEVTHIVTVCNAAGMCPRTVKIVQGILSGKWILNMEWLSLCSEMNSVVCEEAFEVQGLSVFPNCQSPYKGRMNRKQQLPGLFDGCWFYFNGEFEYSVPSKDDLLATIKLGGGKILSREPKPGHLDMGTLTVPYHIDSDSEMKDCCTFVVYETGSKYQPIRTKYICSVPASWVIDCAATFTLLPLPE